MQDCGVEIQEIMGLDVWEGVEGAREEGSCGRACSVWFAGACPSLLVHRLPLAWPLLRCEEEDVEVSEDAKDLLTKIGVETSLRWVDRAGGLWEGGPGWVGAGGEVGGDRGWRGDLAESVSWACHAALRCPVQIRPAPNLSSSPGGAAAQGGDSGCGGREQGLHPLSRCQAQRAVFAGVSDGIHV